MRLLRLYIGTMSTVACLVQRKPAYRLEWHTICQTDLLYNRQWRCVLFYNQNQTWVWLKTSLFSDWTTDSFILLCTVYIQGALQCKRESGVFLDNLKIGLMHYETYPCINQMQHLHACSSLMFDLLRWGTIPESMHSFNQIVYAGYAAKSVKAKPWFKYGLPVIVLKSESLSI